MEIKFFFNSLRRRCLFLSTCTFAATAALWNDRPQLKFSVMHFVIFYFFIWSLKEKDRGSTQKLTDTSTTEPSHTDTIIWYSKLSQEFKLKHMIWFSFVFFPILFQVFLNYMCRQKYLRQVYVWRCDFWSIIIALDVLFFCCFIYCLTFCACMRKVYIHKYIQNVIP